MIKAYAYGLLTVVSNKLYELLLSLLLRQGLLKSVPGGRKTVFSSFRGTGGTSREAARKKNL